MIDVNILQTGSAGNMILIDEVLCIDLGVARKIFLPYADKIEHILVSHCHSDHWNPTNVNWIFKNNPSLFAHGLHVNRETIERLALKKPELASLMKADLGPRSSFDLMTSKGTYHIETYPLVHDVENQGFIITTPSGETLIHATDTETMKFAPKGQYDYLLIEGNWDESVLFNEIMSDDENATFRAVRNLRHLSVQSCHSFMLENSHSSSIAYQLHESDAYGVKLDTSKL